MTYTSRLFLFAAVLSNAPLLLATEPINIGSQRELFVDDYLIDSLQGAVHSVSVPCMDGF